MYGINPIKIENILMHDFDFHGFSRYGEGRFMVLCPLQYLGIGLKLKIPKTRLKLVAIVLMFSNKKISLYKPM